MERTLIVAINLTFTTPSGVYVCAFYQRFQAQRPQSVLLSFRLLALKSCGTSDLDEESEQFSDLKESPWMLRHATEKQRPKDHRYVSRQ